VLKNNCTDPYLEETNLGFSLIELLFAVTILSILTGFTLTFYQTSLLATRLTTLTDRVQAMLYSAQSEAIYRHTPVTVCKSLEGIHCGGTSQSGWLLFLNRYTEHPHPEQRLRVYPHFDPSERVQWRGAGGRDFLTFQADGSVRGYNGRFILCVKILTKTQGRLIKISPTGRIRSEELTDQQACVHETE
jgi:type IV fimbrial biogenesis protein FimT